MKPVVDNVLENSIVEKSDCGHADETADLENRENEVQEDDVLNTETSLHLTKR